MPKRAHRGWHNRLEPFAEIHAQMYEMIKDRLETMTPEQLQQLIKDAEEPDQCNCWCHTYDVAPLVRGEAGFILRQREIRAAWKEHAEKNREDTPAQEIPHG